MTNIWRKNYKESITVEDAIELGISALKKAVDAKLSPENVDISYIEVKTKKSVAVSDKDVAKYLK